MKMDISGEGKEELQEFNKQTQREKDDEDLLKETQNDILQQLLPAIVCISLLCAIGILGNIITIVFYAKKPKRSSTVIMILSLAAVDLMVCASMVLSIFEMAALVTYYSDVLCKLTHFFGRWTIGSSCLILWMISIDRHRKICKPFGKQVNVSRAKRFVLGLVIFAFFLSVKELVHYGSLEIDITASKSNRSITGHYCKEKQGPSYRISISIFNGIDAILITMILVTQIVVYTLIIYRLIKLRLKMNMENIPSTNNNKIEVVDDSDVHNSRMKADKTLGTEDNNWNISETNISSVDLTDDTKTESSETDKKRSTVDEEEEHVPPVMEMEQVYNERKETVLSDTGPGLKEINVLQGNGVTRVMKVNEMTPTEIRLTVMMFSVSLVFLLCFIPYFVLVLWSLAAGKEYELNAGIKFAIRLPYLNSVFNPIIYGIFNAEMRNYVWRQLLESYRRCKRHEK